MQLRQNRAYFLAIDQNRHALEAECVIFEQNRLAVEAE